MASDKVNSNRFKLQKGSQGDKIDRTPTNSKGSISDELEDEVMDSPTIKIPNDTSTPRKSERITGKKIDVINIEIFQVNGKPFDGILPKADLKNLWLAWGPDRKLEEIADIASRQIFNQCLKVAFSLRKPIYITELSRKQEFFIEKTGSHKTDVYKVRLVDFNQIAIKIGQTVTIVVENVLFGASTSKILEWLSCFGSVRSQIR